MTFSDEKVVEFISNEFVPVWDSVAPVTVATFKLDAEREVRSVINGEIALYFCRPDGSAFDVLPGLQSPAATLAAMKEALALYKRTGGAQRWDEIRDYHKTHYVNLTEGRGTSPLLNVALPFRNQNQLEGAADPAGNVLRNIVGKGLSVAPAERIVTVQLGGHELYRSRIHAAFSMASPSRPAQWTQHVFEEILEMPLKGGTQHFETASALPTSLTIIE